MTTENLSFNQLSEKAKQTAISYYSERVLDEGWKEAVYEDAKEIAHLMGIDISDIYYSGFCCQGDGACFEGSFAYKAQALKNVKQYAPLDEKLHRIAKDFTDIQRKAFYKLEGKIVHNDRYYHSNSVDISVEHADDMYRDIGSLEKDMQDVLRSFMDWIYRELEDAYYAAISEENVAEYFNDDETVFEESGHIQ